MGGLWPSDHCSSEVVDVGKREEEDWTGAEGARRHEEADRMVFFGGRVSG